MTEKHRRKDLIRSRGEDSVIHLYPSSEIDISSDDIERALERFSRSVRDEAVPEFWNELAQPAREDAMERQAALTNVSPISHPFNVADSGSQNSEPLMQTKRINSKRWRSLTVLIGAAVVLVGLFTTPLGNRAIADVMQTMYFNNLMALNKDDLSQIEQAFEQNGLTQNSHIDMKQYGSVAVNGGESQTNLTLKYAATQAGLPIKVLPGFDVNRDRVFYTSGVTVTFRLHVNAINTLIQRLGGTTGFPKSVDGQAIVLHVPGQFVEQTGGQKQYTLAEMKVPSLQVPSDVDLNQVRAALLSLPFLPNDMRNALSQSENWKDTLYVPNDGSGSNVTVSGNPAVLNAGQNGSFPTIYWLESGVLYELQGSPNAFPTKDALIAEAKELAE